MAHPLNKLEDLLPRALKGDPLALGKLARILDDGEPEAGRILAGVYPLGGKAHLVGITGPPGAGKSTLVSALIGQARGRGRKVGVLAVDPSSPYSGGAILGDRVRMQEHATDPGVFIRSLATRGHMGGLSRSVQSLVALLDAASFDMVIIETVGVGQEEVEIRNLAQTTVYVTVPGLGDGIQALKAGVLEIAAIYLVNKADLPMVEATVADLKAMTGMSGAKDGWLPPVLTAAALEGKGVAELLEAVEEHRQHLVDSGGLRKWALSTAMMSFRDALNNLAEEAIEGLLRGGGGQLEDDIARVSRREEDPVSVAERWLARLEFRKT